MPHAFDKVWEIRVSHIDMSDMSRCYTQHLTSLIVILFLRVCMLCDMFHISSRGEVVINVTFPYVSFEAFLVERGKF